MRLRILNENKCVTKTSLVYKYVSLGYECKLHPVVSLSTDKSG